MRCKSSLRENLLRLSAAALLIVVCFAGPTEAAVKFAVIGDRTGEHIEGIYGQIVQRVNEFAPDFAVTVGDQIEGYETDTAILDTEWAEYDSIVAALNAPLHVTPGNHDITYDTVEAYYAANRGKPFYSVDDHGVHLIVLDNSRFSKTSDFSSEQLDWLADDLANNQSAPHTFVFMHKPFWFDTVADGLPDTLHTLFVKYGVDGVFSGHFHSYFGGTFDGVKYTNVGSSGGDAEPAPTGMAFHFVAVSIDGDSISIQPISLDGAVHPWDEVTLADVKFMDQIKYRGIEILQPLEIGEDLNLRTHVMTVRLTNLCSDRVIEDTIRWDTPDGWTVEPTEVPLSISAGESMSAEFTMLAGDNLIPLPTLLVSYPFADNKEFTVKKSARAVRFADCVPVNAAPLIDGIVNEIAWGDPESRFFAPGGGDPVTDSADFYFAYDADNLYLAAICYDPHPDSIKTSASGRDGALFGDDCVGYFIQPDIDDGKAYMVYVSANGTLFDQELVVGNDGYTDYFPKWNGSYNVATGRGEDYWSVEVAIPLEQWGVKGEPGKKWGINFRRKQPRMESAADWQTPIDYSPESYGCLMLK